jgi:hypothetical protein
MGKCQYFVNQKGYLYYEQGKQKYNLIERTESNSRTTSYRGINVF